MGEHRKASETNAFGPVGKSKLAGVKEFRYGFADVALLRTDCGGSRVGPPFLDTAELGQIVTRAREQAKRGSLSLFSKRLPRGSRAIR